MKPEENIVLTLYMYNSLSDTTMDVGIRGISLPSNMPPSLAKLSESFTVKYATYCDPREVILYIHDNVYVGI